MWASKRGRNAEVSLAPLGGAKSVWLFFFPPPMNRFARPSLPRRNSKNDSVVVRSVSQLSLDIDQRVAGEEPRRSGQAAQCVQRHPAGPRRRRAPPVRLEPARPLGASSRERTTHAPRSGWTLTALPRGRSVPTSVPMFVSNVSHVPAGEDGTGPQTAENPTFAGFPMRPGRFELPRPVKVTRPSTLRVYQFRHRRVGG
jgi:hypothetical protein